MNKKRSQLEIIYSILKVIQDNQNHARPTKILYKSNLSHKMLAKYINELIKKGFLTEEKDNANRKFYSLTTKGFKFIEDYNKIKSFMESYGLEE